MVVDEQINLEQLLEQWRLKDQVRTGWQIRGVPDPESVADHSWGTAMLCLRFAEREQVNAGKAVHMALIHDLAEATVGDIPRRVAVDQQPVSPQEKHRREREAMDDLAQGSPETLSLWEEYERGETRTAGFVRDMNLIDMCMQAIRYEIDDLYDEGATRHNFPDYHRLDEFFATSEPRISTGTGRILFQVVHAHYRKVRRTVSE